MRHPLLLFFSLSSCNFLHVRESILNYAQNEERSFSSLPFNALDGTILSWLSYLHFPFEKPVLLSDQSIAGSMDTVCADLFGPEKTRKLYSALCSGRRFSGTQLILYSDIMDDELQMQFSASAFLLPDGDLFVSYRGTDNSLTGWKEDCNMAFECPVPSQSAAVSFLKKAAAAASGRIYTGGHSKGGNLAVYAAALADAKTKKRLVSAYSIDGPGFPEEFYSTQSYASVRERIVKLVPQSSCVGMLMNGNEKVRIVRSDSLLFLQHYPLSWRVDGDDFVYLDELSAQAVYFSNVSRDIMSRLTKQQRFIFIETVYETLSAMGFHKAFDVVLLLPVVLAAVNRKIRTSSKEDRPVLEHAADVISRALKENLSR